MKYTVTVLVKRDEFQFMIQFSSEKFYRDDVIESALFNFKVLELGDSVLRIRFTSTDSLNNLDRVIDKYNITLDKISSKE